MKKEVLIWRADLLEFPFNTDWFERGSLLVRGASATRVS